MSVTGADRFRECVNTEFKQGFVKAAVVSRAARLRECPLREPRMYTLPNESQSTDRGRM